jgi:hypothetical protein
LGDDIGGYTISTGIPSSWYLASDSTAELESLGNENTDAFLELDEPLAALASPDVTFFAMFVFEFRGFGFGYFNWLQIMNELDFLIEEFLARVVATE